MLLETQAAAAHHATAGSPLPRISSSDFIEYIALGNRTHPQTKTLDHYPLKLRAQRGHPKSTRPLPIEQPPAYPSLRFFKTLPLVHCSHQPCSAHAVAAPTRQHRPPPLRISREIPTSPDGTMQPLGTSPTPSPTNYICRQATAASPCKFLGPLHFGFLKLFVNISGDYQTLYPTNSRQPWLAPNMPRPSSSVSHLCLTQNRTNAVFGAGPGADVGVLLDRGLPQCRASTIRIPPSSPPICILLREPPATSADNAALRNNATMQSPATTAATCARVPTPPSKQPYRLVAVAPSHSAAPEHRLLLPQFRCGSPEILHPPRTPSVLCHYLRTACRCSTLPGPRPPNPSLALS